MSDLIVPRNDSADNTNTEPIQLTGWLTLSMAHTATDRDVLRFVYDQLKVLDDVPTPENAGLWAQAINVVWAAVEMQLETPDTAQRGGEGVGE